MNWEYLVDLLHAEFATGAAENSLARLVPLAILGGFIGLEREVKHRPAELFRQFRAVPQSAIALGHVERE